jgi:uncharacterized protein (TIGR02246 family)
MPVPSDIQELLDRSAAAWNQGDLAGFMESYERSPDTIYVSAHDVIRGYAAIEAHYAAAYGGPTGTLMFSELTIRPLGDDHAVVVGRYHLSMPEGDAPTGLFSLVLQRGARGWHIIADHST